MQISFCSSKPPALRLGTAISTVRERWPSNRDFRRAGALILTFANFLSADAVFAQATSGRLMSSDPEGLTALSLVSVVAGLSLLLLGSIMVLIQRNHMHERHEYSSATEAFSNNSTSYLHEDQMIVSGHDSNYTDVSIIRESNPGSAQHRLTAWRQSVLRNKVAQESDAMAVLYDVSLHDVEEFLRYNDFLGFNVRFEPHRPVSEESEVLGNLFAVEMATTQHSMAGGKLVQEILFAAYEATGYKELELKPPFDFKFKKYIKQADISLFPSRSSIGNGVLDDGYGFPTPTLVVEIAYSESRAQLLRELAAWISADTSVQVAIGIKMYPYETESDKAEALVYRRGFKAPEQVVRFSPENGRPTIKLHLRDLFFGVVQKLPGELQDRIARDETIEIDLGLVRREIFRNRQ